MAGNVVSQDPLNPCSPHLNSDIGGVGVMDAERSTKMNDSVLNGMLPHN